MFLKTCQLSLTKGFWTQGLQDTVDLINKFYFKGKEKSAFLHGSVSLAKLRLKVSELNFHISRKFYT